MVRVLVLIFCMPLQLLFSSILFVAPTMATKPFLWTFSSILDILYALRFRDLLKRCKFHSSDDFIPAMLVWNGRYQVSDRCAFELPW